jgi:hypothetical protein
MNIDIIIAYSDAKELPLIEEVLKDNKIKVVKILHKIKVIFCYKGNISIDVIKNILKPFKAVVDNNKKQTI